jgi:prophage endopeptidase
MIWRSLFKDEFGMWRWRDILVTCLVCFALGALAGLSTGYAWEHRARLAEVAQIRADIARREAEAAEASRRRIEAASRAMDAALAEKDRRVLELDATNRRLRHDLQAATTGRPCLSPAARGLLQQSPAFGLKLPTATGSALAAPAAPAADSGEQGGDSTDTDIAGWILDAASLYEACRARLDAIRRWDELTHGDGHGR